MVSDVAVVLRNLRDATLMLAALQKHVNILSVIFHLVSLRTMGKALKLSDRMWIIYER